MTSLDYSRIVEKYVIVPYKDNGRDMTGLDCYGLVYLVLRDEFGKHVPELAGVYDAHASEVLERNRPLVPAMPVDVPEDGDIMLVYQMGKPCHVGVYLGGHILHTSRGRGCSYEPLDRFKRREFYRVDD